MNVSNVNKCDPTQIDVLPRNRCATGIERRCGDVRFGRPPPSFSSSKRNWLFTVSATSIRSVAYTFVEDIDVHGDDDDDEEGGQRRRLGGWCGWHAPVRSPSARVAGGIFNSLERGLSSSVVEPLSVRDSFHFLLDGRQQ
eukprot:GHVU01095894.1.p2 GENE.GHVU01095894.1~~GHVU01095894.1.p2  ORF type:complete len:140 (+),score=7.38 GHVU01095894.1:203-622(+)